MIDWREGTWTMTQDQKITWMIDGDEILVSFESGGDVDADRYLSERQAENMITGLSYQLTEMRKARNRASS